MAQPNNGFQNAAFNNNTIGPNSTATRHSQARTTILAQAEAILRQPNQLVANVQALPQTAVGPG
jgi:hypothetical protein